MSSQLIKLAHFQLYPEFSKHWLFWKSFKMKTMTFRWHTPPEAMLRKIKCSRNMCHNFFGWGLLRKSVFSFCGALKNFFWPLKPHFPSETPTLGGRAGVTFQKLFDPSIVKIAILGQNHPWLSLKPYLSSNSFRSMTHKVCAFLRPNKVFGVKKSF